MRYWLGVTDNRWYNFVSSRAFAEVNFWQPSALAPFGHLPAGTPFLFKLKRPNNHIAGGGYFVHFTILPLATAWNAFGQANGAESLRDFSNLIAANAVGQLGANQEIGCSVLTNTFFLPRDRWIPMTGRIPTQVVRGSTFNTENHEGQALWDEVLAAAGDRISDNVVSAELPRFGRPFLTSARLGQGPFRTLVMEAYKRKCAITGESTLPTLEAAHIQSYADHGPHQVSNGLLMRSDFHKLFDVGLITVTPERKILVSPRIHEQWYNGKAYYRLHGQELRVVPDNLLDRPNVEYLRWHNERFLA